jgi:hypothetical protein
MEAYLHTDMVYVTSICVYACGAGLDMSHSADLLPMAG